MGNADIQEQTAKNYTAASCSWTCCLRGHVLTRGKLEQWWTSPQSFKLNEKNWVRRSRPVSTNWPKQCKAATRTYYLHVWHAPGPCPRNWLVKAHLELRKFITQRQIGACLRTAFSLKSFRLNPFRCGKTWRWDEVIPTAFQICCLPILTQGSSRLVDV